MRSCVLIYNLIYILYVKQFKDITHNIYYTTMDNTKKMTSAEKAKLYRQRNPERWRATLEKYWKKRKVCECGELVSNKLRHIHKKSNKHIMKLKIKEYEETIEKMKLLEAQPNVEVKV